MSVLLPPQRPPSRSERLLRETLRRDGEVRESALSSPSRRHSSRVSSPTSPPLPTSLSCGELHSPRPSSPYPMCRYADLAADEQYTRGTFLFRSAITNPSKMVTHVQGSTDAVLNGNGHYDPSMSTRSASPSPGRHALHAQLEGYYFGSTTQQCSPTLPHMTNYSCGDQTRSGQISQPHFEPASTGLCPPSPPRMHARSRSSTDPSGHRTATNTTPTQAPRKTSSAMTHPSLSTRSRKHTSIELTPPLTADASPTSIGERNELEPDYELDYSRLITPPPSPPMHITSNVSRKSHLHHPHPHSPSPSPYHHPIGDWSNSTVDQHRGLHTTPIRHTVPVLRPQSSQHSQHSQHSQFNVRKASEQCKLIDGYVSFLSIEGLGGPPGADSPVVGNDEGLEDEEGQGREKRMFGIGWNGLKKLLPLAVVGAMNNGNAPAGHQQTAPTTTTTTTTAAAA